MIAYPQIDPVAFSLFGFAVRWYGLAYVAGFLGGFFYAVRLSKIYHHIFTPALIDKALTWIMIGVVLGGRLGYVLFYKPGFYLAHPEEILQIWQGGMSFHGGFLGAAIALWFFARREKLPFLPLADLAAVVAPIGLGFGRLANFINGELYGRAADVPWAMIFPHSDGLLRHPSQLYQMGMEGVLLGLFLWGAVKYFSVLSKKGMAAGLFLIGYAIARMVGEIFREPDAFLGFVIGPVTYGQILSLPMLILGIYLVRRARNLSC